MSAVAAGERHGFRVGDLEEQARHARERYRLYRARAYSSKPTSRIHLRDLERTSNLADRLLDQAKAAPPTA
jgi:hypothetical protein